VLTPEQKQQIRDEESFRAEIRNELARSSGPPTFLSRVSAFFESKVGFWLLTTGLAGLAAAGLASFQSYWNRVEIANRAKAERSLRDADMLLKLGPMLTSHDRSQVDFSIVILNGLALDQAVDPGISEQVKSLIKNTIAAGAKPDATPEQRAQASAILSFYDPPRADGAAQPNAMPVPIDSATLPIRVYIQIEAGDQSRAKAAERSLQDAGVIVPGIETVRQRVPSDNVRYCADKVAPDAIERVKAALQPSVPGAQFAPLNPKLCTHVRFNHFELWFANHAS